MGPISKNEYDLGMRILEAFEGSITKDEFAELEKQLQADPAAARQYLEQIMNHAALMWRGEALTVGGGAGSDEMQLLDELGAYERTAPTVEVKLPEVTAVAAAVIKPARAARQINKASLIVAAASLAAMLFLMAYVWFIPSGAEPVATMTDSMHAVWGESSAGGVEMHSRMKAHAGAMELKSGYVKIVYDYGTEVVIEGPARFEILGPEEMAVSSGQVYARAPSSAIGFTVSTPNSKIIDLGTEFGVKVAGDGSTDVHMIKGKASLIAGQKGDTKLNEIVNGGVARRVDTNKQIKAIQLQDELFARQISSKTGIVWRGEKINLADVVGGGNGLGVGRPGRGVSLTTGQSLVGAADDAKAKSRGGYVGVADVETIDGVFVPDVVGGKDLVVTSAGDAFANCPDTTGSHFAGIYYGQVSQAGANEYFSMVLNGQTASALTPAICMYGNAGITFDMNVVRRLIPQCRIKRFHAVCGLSPNAASGQAESMCSEADVFVLLDGKPAFEAMALSRFSAQREIDVAIDAGVRFLTLVGTDGGMPAGADWTVFAGPYLELVMEN